MPKIGELDWVVSKWFVSLKPILSGFEETQ